MWVLEVKVEVTGLNCFDRDAPCLLVFDAGFETVFFITPPKALGFKFFDADGFAFVIAFRACGIGVLVIPDVGGGCALGEEE